MIKMPTYYIRNNFLPALSWPLPKSSIDYSKPLIISADTCLTHIHVSQASFLWDEGK